MCCTILFNVCKQFIMFRASTSVDVKLCKIQKATNFTHFAPKIFHISLSKTVYIITCAIVIMHICTVLVDVYPIILLISHFAPFFLSLFSVHNELNDFSSPYLLFPQIHTNTPTQTNQQRNRSVLVLVACGSVLVALDQSSWVDENGSKCCGSVLATEISACGSTGMGFDAGSGDQCLWVN